MRFLNFKPSGALLAFALLCGLALGLAVPRGQSLRNEPAAAALSYAAEAELAAAPSSVQPPLTATPAPVNIFAIELMDGDAPALTGSAALSPAPTGTPPPSAAAPTAADGFTLEVAVESPPPQKRILIYHTHTYEAYEKQADYQETQQWRTADERYNVVRVGKELAGLLTGMGFTVEHDATAFEPPELSDAYSRSLQMLEARQAAGERYDLMIDLHRDAYLPSQAGANAVSVGSVSLARLMVLVGKGEGQTGQGFAEKPDWENNQRVAQAITDALNGQLEGLCKNVMLKAGRYNQHKGAACVLIEVGNNRNTLAEALAAMPYLADAISEAVK